MAISINNVHKTYKGRRTEQVNALRGVSFTLPEKGLVFILGKSGCGKSTLLNVLGGLDGFDEGDIVVDGKSMKGFSAKDYDNYRNNYVGFVFQENNLLEQYTVKRNVGLALELQSQKGVDEKIAKALERVDLKDFGERRCNRLSGGQKQRVAIARALIKEPEMLLCDEPTGSLDSTTGKEIFELLKKISENTLVVVVSHDRESAEKYGDRVIEIKDGTVLSDSKPEEVKATEQKQRGQKKRGLPFKRAFAIGAGYLIARPVRLVLCVLLCLITFTCIGISDAFGAYDGIVCAAENMRLFKTSHMSYKRQQMYEDEEGFSTTQDFIMNRNTAEEIKQFVKSSRYDYRYYTLRIHSDLFREMNSFRYYYEPNGMVEMDKNLPADYGFELYGRCPETENEIVITKHLYKAFESFGYKDYQPSNRFEYLKINGYDDMIGKTVSFENNTSYNGAAYLEFTVVGILDTKLNENMYGKYIYPAEFTFESNLWSPPSGAPTGMDVMLSEGMHCSVFVCGGYAENVLLPRLVEYFGEDAAVDNVESIAGIFTPAPDGMNALKSCASVYKRSKEYVEESSYGLFTAFHLSNEATKTVEFANSDMYIFKEIFKWVSLAAIVIAMLFLLYHTEGIISGKKREIGILRALGASRGDLLKILSAENGIFALGIICISTVLAAVGIVVLNSVILSSLEIKAVLLSFGIRQFAVLAAVAIGAIIVGIAIPIFKLLRAKPVDIIAGRK